MQFVLLLTLFGEIKPRACWRWKIQKRLGLPEQRLHDLRAYAITDLLSEGISPHEVSDRVGAKAETRMKQCASMKPERRILIAKQSGDRLDHKLQK